MKAERTASRTARREQLLVGFGERLVRVTWDR